MKIFSSLILKYIANYNTDFIFTSFLPTLIFLPLMVFLILFFYGRSIGPYGSRIVIIVFYLFA